MTYELVEDARNRSADVILGGEIPEGSGYLYPPTIITNVPPDATVVRNEIFGPIAPIVCFDTEDEAVFSHDTEYGLAAYLFTQDLSRILRLSDRIECGMLGVNSGIISAPAAPFGGVKQSGLGREGGDTGLSEYQEFQYVGLASPYRQG